MKNYEITIWFPETPGFAQSSPNMNTVKLEASNEQSAVFSATRPSWYDVGDGKFMPVSAITLVTIHEIKE